MVCRCFVRGIDESSAGVIAIWRIDGLDRLHPVRCRSRHEIGHAGPNHKTMVLLGGRSECGPAGQCIARDRLASKAQCARTAPAGQEQSCAESSALVFVADLHGTVTQRNRRGRPEVVVDLCLPAVVFGRERRPCAVDRADQGGVAIDGIERFGELEVCQRHGQQPTRLSSESEGHRIGQLVDVRRRGLAIDERVGSDRDEIVAVGYMSKQFGMRLLHLPKQFVAGDSRIKVEEVFEQVDGKVLGPLLVGALNTRRKTLKSRRRHPSACRYETRWACRAPEPTATRGDREPLSNVSPVANGTWPSSPGPVANSGMKSCSGMAVLMLGRDHDPSTHGVSLTRVRGRAPVGSRHRPSGS